MMPWRGRRRGPRWISFYPNSYIYAPMDRVPAGRVIVYLSELEAMRLVDVENLTQEEAAEKMGVSRKTLWTDLTRGRMKIINALLNGYIIEIRRDEVKKE